MDLSGWRPHENLWSSFQWIDVVLEESNGPSGWTLVAARVEGLVEQGEVSCLQLSRELDEACVGDQRPSACATRTRLTFHGAPRLVQFAAAVDDSALAANGSSPAARSTPTVAVYQSGAWDMSQRTSQVDASSMLESALVSLRRRAARLPTVPRLVYMTMPVRWAGAVDWERRVVARANADGGGRLLSSHRDTQAGPQHRDTHGPHHRDTRGPQRGGPHVALLRRNTRGAFSKTCADWSTSTAHTAPAPSTASVHSYHCGACTVCRVVQVQMLSRRLTQVGQVPPTTRPQCRRRTRAADSALSVRAAKRRAARARAAVAARHDPAAARLAAGMLLPPSSRPLRTGRGW
jgi:hypothetical protein